jgi:sensor histidine kinase YesM
LDALAYLFGFIYSVCITGILSPSAHLVWNLTSRLPAFLSWTVRAAWVALGTAAGCLLAGLVRLALSGARSPYWTAFKESYGIAIVLSVFATSFVVVYDRFRAQLETTELQLKEKEVEREKALKLATEATLSSLESRLHPHFLFNTINSIASLIQDDPARAEKMLSQMADLLRFSLDSARSGPVPLSRELKIVRDYLEIEKARFESRLRYDIHVPAEFEDLPFPPLSLQTLVENSVKYAVSVTRAGADILIYAHLDSSRLVLTVEDNGPGFAPSHLPSGHGLASLSARLESLYGRAGHLEISSQPGRTRVSLHVPAAVAV